MDAVLACREGSQRAISTTRNGTRATASQHAQPRPETMHAPPSNPRSKLQARARNAKSHQSLEHHGPTTEECKLQACSGRWASSAGEHVQCRRRHAPRCPPWAAAEVDGCRPTTPSHPQNVTPTQQVEGGYVSTPTVANTVPGMVLLLV